MLGGFMENIPFFKKYVLFFFLLLLIAQLSRPHNIIWEGESLAYSKLSNLNSDFYGDPVFDAENIDIE
jgi:hypothetical protein